MNWQGSWSLGSIFNAARNLSRPGRPAAVAAPPAAMAAPMSPTMVEAMRAASAKYLKMASAAASPERPESLGAAIRRQVLLHGGKVRNQIGLADNSNGPALAEELRTRDDDSLELGVAKAVARNCVKQIGAKRSARPIEAVRRLAAGGNLADLQETAPHDFMRGPRVLSAVPRR